MGAPLLIALALLIAGLTLFRVDYQVYFGNAVLHFMLGPATVALAVPLYYDYALPP